MVLVMAILLLLLVLLFLHPCGSANIDSIKAKRERCETPRGANVSYDIVIFFSVRCGDDEDNNNDDDDTEGSDDSVCNDLLLFVRDGISDDDDCVDVIMEEYTWE